MKYKRIVCQASGFLPSIGRDTHRNLACGVPFVVQRTNSKYNRGLKIVVQSASKVEWAKRLPKHFFKKGQFWAWKISGDTNVAPFNLVADTRYEVFLQKLAWPAGF